MTASFIRKATLEDAEGIAFVHVKSWQTSYAGIVDQNFLDNISYEKRLSMRQEFLKSKNTLHLVAVLNDRIVGFADAGPLREESCLIDYPFDKSKTAELYTLYLLNECKGQGFGRAFFKECRNWFSEKGYQDFITLVLKDNHPARRFYEREHGVVIGEAQTQIEGSAFQESFYLFPVEE